MERNWLICTQLGYLCAKKPHLNGVDLRIELDQFLIDSKFTPIGTEAGDISMLDELIGEMTMGTIGRGHNRRDRRS